MNFKRDNLNSKKNYYLTLILIEVFGYIALFFTDIHWIFLVLVFPLLMIEIISNKRCLNRQKNFITEIDFREKEIVLTFLKKGQKNIDYKDLIYSFREIKFEKDQSEIEIKTKGRLKNKLIGRIHLSDWNKIFEIKNALVKKGITRVKFKPEGFWNKYGGLTADVVITASALTVSAIDDSNSAADLAFESDFDDLHKKNENKTSS